MCVVLSSVADNEPFCCLQIGNKRLKVQHKQIRAGERDSHHGHSPGYHGEYAGGGEYSSAGGEYPTVAAIDSTSPRSAVSGGSWYDEPKAAQDDRVAVEGENRDVYEGKSPEKEGADLHRSGLGNLDPLRNALPDISGAQGAVK